MKEYQKTTFTFMYFLLLHPRAFRLARVAFLGTLFGQNGRKHFHYHFGAANLWSQPSEGETPGGQREREASARILRLRPARRLGNVK